LTIEKALLFAEGKLKNYLNLLTRKIILIANKLSSRGLKSTSMRIFIYFCKTKSLCQAW